jgi:hypothetical protein
VVDKDKARSARPLTRKFLPVFLSPYEACMNLWFCNNWRNERLDIFCKKNIMWGISQGRVMPRYILISYKFGLSAVNRLVEIQCIVQSKLKEA